MSIFGVDIPKSSICVLPDGLTKGDALDVLIDAISGSGAISGREQFRQAIHEREAVMSTGIGGGIAIPHVRIPEVRYATLGIAVAPGGLEFDALDNNPVHIMVLFATPEGANKEYLGLLAKVMSALKDRDTYDRLLACTSPEEVETVLNS